MRRALLLFFLLLVPPALSHSGHGNWPPGNHGPSIEYVLWSPNPILRGDAVQVFVAAAPGVEVEAIRLTYCRVPKYACALALTMDEGPDGYQATIPWDNRFFRPATFVGINLTVEHPAAAKDFSPASDWPGTPPELPPDAGQYYFYELPPPSNDAPALGLLAVLGVGLLASVGSRRGTP